MSKEYIDRNELLKLYQEHELELTFIPKKVIQNFKDIPAADVAEVVHGEWVAEIERTGTYSHCSECSCRCAGYTPNYKYCPNCGAKMRGD